MGVEYCSVRHSDALTLLQMLRVATIELLTRMNAGVARKLVMGDASIVNATHAYSEVLERQELRA